MILEFIKILESEIISTLEGLTGVVPTVKFNKKSPPDIKKALSLPLVTLDVSVKDNDDFKMKIAIPALLSTAISDMMLGGEGELTITTSKLPLTLTHFIKPHFIMVDHN